MRPGSNRPRSESSATVTVRLQVPRVRYSEPVQVSEPNTGSEYPTCGTRQSGLAAFHSGTQTIIVVRWS
jgi:hypothetical protein